VNITIYVVCLNTRINKIKIKLKGNNSLYAIIDDEDYQLAQPYKWYLNIRGQNKYAHTHCYVNGRRTMIKMHRLILGTDKNIPIDHINGDGLDNRKSNLREFNYSLNKLNQRYKTPNCTSQYVGVHFNKKISKWKAQIWVDGEYYYLGAFDIEHDAYQARIDFKNKKGIL